MNGFEGFGLSPALLASLARMNYTTPTPIQAQAIPLALEGHDIMGTAQTGTGKTAAFAIPLVERLLTNPGSAALVLTPTRELGKQIMDIMHQLLGQKSAIKTAFIIGGEPMGKQYAQLRAQPRLIVGTPGRINDHLERGSLNLAETDFLVLDETDRMLDMGFSVQLERIFKYMPQKRQTLMFSATLPPNILKLSENYFDNPRRVAAGETNVVAQNLKQEVIRIEQEQKYHELTLQLHDRDGSVIVFVKTKYGADRMAKNLRRDGFTSEAIHGDLKQNKRDKVMENFRNRNFRVLIATDIAARGLDVPHIEHVINYDLPQVAEDFIHRMGRTARAGAQGSAVSFVSSQDMRKWQAIERLLFPKAANDKKTASGKGAGGKKNVKSGKPAAGKGKAPARKAFGDKPFGKKTFGGKPKAEGSRSEDGKKFGDKPFGKKTFGGKPKAEGSRSEGGKTFGDKPFGKKTFGGKPKAEGSRSEGGKSFGGKPFSGKVSDSDRGGKRKPAGPYKGRKTTGSAAPYAGGPKKRTFSKKKPIAK